MSCSDCCERLSGKENQNMVGVVLAKRRRDEQHLSGEQGLKVSCTRYDAISTFQSFTVWEHDTVADSKVFQDDITDWFEVSHSISRMFCFPS